MLIAAALLLAAPAAAPAAPAPEAPAAAPGRGADSAYQAAARPWADCTRRQIALARAAAGSGAAPAAPPAAPGSEEAIVEAAFAACAAEEERVRAHVVAVHGEAMAGRLMPAIRGVAGAALAKALRAAPAR